MNNFRATFRSYSWAHTAKLLLKRLVFGLTLLFFVGISTQANATCQINGESYRTTGQDSVDRITLKDIRDRAGSWNNITDLITTCDISEVVSLNKAFEDNTTFNQDISDWDISHINNMNKAFRGASAFNQDIRPWDIGDPTNFNFMFQNATAMIATWSTADPPMPTGPNSENALYVAWFGSDDDSAAPTVSFSPATSATAVANGSDITITFDEAVRLSDDSALDNADLAALITLKSGSSSGSDLSFSASVNAGKTVITINPSTDFTSEEVIYVAISNGVEDVSDNAISASTATFTAADSAAPTVSFSPATSATAVANGSDITITFDEAVQLGFRR